MISSASAVTRPPAARPGRLPALDRRGTSARGIASATVVLLCLALSLPGLPYYLASPAERVRHALHPWLKPSGYVGQTAGLVALAMFLFLWLYPLRKRIRWFAWGHLPRWLDVHIVAGLGLPLVGAIHAGWRFTGLIGLGYLAMLVVSLSGIVGRFLYTRIPRSRDGLELSREQVELRRRELAAAIAERLDLDAAAVGTHLEEVLDLVRPRGTGALPIALAAGRWIRRRAVRRLRRDWSARAARLDGRQVRELGRMIRVEVALTQQLELLDATRRVFRLWHVAHLPVALTALGAVLVHVAVVVALGVTWLR